MTEEQIRAGYERLDSALHGPQDAVDRVEKRMRARRRRRRIGTVVGTAVVVAAAGGYVAVSIGDSDDGRGDVVAVEPPPESLVMTRPDGSTYEFEDLTTSCAPPGAAPEGGASGDLSRVYLYSPILVEGERLEQPFVLIEAEVAKLQEPRTFTLSVDDAEGSSGRSVPLTLFMADTEGAPDGNEVASSSPSTGTVRVTQASCSPTPVLELEVDVTLASEEQTDDGQQKQSLDLTGFVR
jgi:hypothetical protein